MKNLETLIQELCPEGVEFVKLGDVCEIKTGKGITQKDCSESDIYPVYSGGKEPMGYYKEYNRNENTVTISRVGAYAGFVNYVTEKFYLNDKCFSVIPKTNDIVPKFLYYKLKSVETNIINLQSGGGVPTINTKKAGGLDFPLPPLEVQTEIVRILDKFTQLEAELEAELDCRKRQYEYYRDKLLSFENITPPERDKVVWKKMSEVGTFIRGKRFVRTDIVDEGIPCIHYGDMYMYYGLTATKARTHLTEEKAQKMRFASQNDVIIVGAGENNIDIGIGMAWLGDEDVAVHDACYIFKSDLNPRYVSHYLRGSKYHLQIKKYVCEGKICSISAQSIGRAIIPIPSLQEQERIANLLDRFESLTTSLQSGLPAEIAARRQQYEYYRDKLLTFKRKTV